MRFRNWGRLEFIAEELAIMLDVRNYPRAIELLGEFSAIVFDAVRRPPH
jgi:hypothetical protein